MFIALRVGHKIVHIHSLSIFFLFSYFHIAYFSFLFRDPRKRGREEYFRICEISYYSQESVPLAIFNHLWYVHKILRLLMVEQIFRLPHVKRSVIISYKLVYTSFSRVAKRLKNDSERSQTLIALLPST